ncbi:unnamed protein product [Phytophthora lilii]|uniref:Unnamed protein product n=1 Tax=Phytophthora lilii TaxID=2077276 RepID=A0A9W7CPT6_9STRA|nr:unnamed protein product [Phytophthora lilii]
MYFIGLDLCCFGNRILSSSSLGRNQISCWTPKCYTQLNLTYAIVSLHFLIKKPDWLVEINGDTMRDLREGFNQKLVITSVNELNSIAQARTSIGRPIIAKPDLEFEMLPVYSKVLSHIRITLKVEMIAIQNAQKRQLPYNLDEVIPLHIPVVQNLTRNISQLNGQFDRILDPQLMIDIIREVINHQYEGKDGECYDALRRDGTLEHSLR